MIDFPYLSNICRTTSSKIIMVVVDGLGGMRHPKYGMSELEAAKIPALDTLASGSSCGVTIPVLPGITPGSGPGHMALFGYNPVKYLLGRGVLEGMGIGANIGPSDVAARGNFCRIDSEGKIIDRRAGRLDSSECKRLVELLNRIELDKVEFEVYPVMDYRFVLVLRGEGISPYITETDPQVEGEPPNKSESLPGLPNMTADAVNEFTQKAAGILKGSGSEASGVLLRGFSGLPNIPQFGASYGLTPAAIAAYPMYRGLAQLVGMDVISCESTFESELRVLKANYVEKFDYFFIHYKLADSAGEDGDFEMKTNKLEEFDAYLERITALNPDVLVVCGDHATPSYTSSHSWHPVPFLIKSQYSEGAADGRFSEIPCRLGSFGSINAEQLMLSVLAHAGKLNKFGP